MIGKFAAASPGRLLATVVCFFLALAAGACSKVAPSLAITHVVVIDATGSEPKLNSTVVIVDGRIRGIGPAESTAIPRGAQVVDGTGKF